MINNILRNTFKKEFLETILPQVSLLTFEVKDVTSETVWSRTSPKNNRSIKSVSHVGAAE
jgi:hypothetical protein